MKIVKAGYKIHGECATNINDTLTEIEYAGRTAYQSHEKITPDSAIRFIKMIAEKGHHSVLEHSNIVAAQSHPHLENFPGNTQLPYHMVKRVGDIQYVSGNIRAWIDYLNDPKKAKPQALLVLIKNYLSPFFNFPLDEEFKISSNFRIVTDHEEIPSDMKRVMVAFTCPRKLSHELVRHRPRVGITQESSRYVRYKELRVHRPTEKATPLQQDLWFTSMAQTENIYTLLLKDGCKAEIARAVLPLSTSTQLIITADIEEWKWIFHLRCSSGADPAMRELMIPLRDEFKKIGWT